MLTFIDVIYTIIIENPIVHSDYRCILSRGLEQGGGSRLNSIENACKNFYEEGLQNVGKCHIILAVLEIQAFLIFLKVIAERKF